MTDIRFYHLKKQSLDQALPLILEKAYQGNHKIIVQLADAKEVERMNGLLWTYHPNKFLPHGSKKNGQASAQPIWITDKDENPNSADVIITAQGAVCANPENYSLCCEMLDGHDETAINAARARWKEYQEAGHMVTYWHQSESGSWEKKA